MNNKSLIRFMDSKNYNEAIQYTSHVSNFLSQPRAHSPINRYQTLSPEIIMNEPKRIDGLYGGAKNSRPTTSTDT